MHKDANLRKRNALVIPGGLLAVYGLIGLVYVAAVRGDSGSCEDAGLVFFLGACRSAYVLLAIPLIIGLALVAVGALAARNTSTCREGHGSWTHFGLAFLISLVVLPLLAFLAVPSVLGSDAVYTRGTVDYPITTILAGLTAVGVLMLVPFMLLYSAQRRANPCCREKGCFDPCFCDETVAPEQPVASEPLDLAPAPAPLAETPAAPAPEPVAPVPPVVEPLAAPSTGASEWKAVPQETPQQWEVVAEEPKEDGNDDGGSRRPSQRPAPRLASRPTDPAAPPADAMAVAAKWAEEDEEALQELEGTASGRRKQATASKKAAKAKAKAAKKGKK